jgi:hypothetical protein
MHSPAERGLRIATWAMLIVGYLALSAVNSISTTIVLLPLIFIALAPLGEWLDDKYSTYRWLSTSLSILCLCSLPYMFWALRMELIDVVTLLVIYIQGYEMCHRKKPRNYYHIFLMAFFLLVSACVRDPEPLIGLVMAAFLVSAVWAFSLLEIEKAISGGRTLPLPDVVPLHVRVPMDIPSAKRLDAQVLVSTIVMSVACVLLTIALFIATPRMEAGILGRDESPRSASVGRAAVVRIAGGVLSRTSRPAMRVTFPDEPNGQFDGPKYWRSTPLATYEGNSWSRTSFRNRISDPGARRFVARANDPEYIARQPTREEAQLVRQTIFLEYSENSEVRTVPALDLVLEISEPSAPMKWVRGRGTAIEFRGQRSSCSYEAVSEIYQATPDRLRQAQNNYADILRSSTLTNFTRHDLRQDTIALTQRLTRNEPTVYDKVVAIQKYLQSDRFIYSLIVPELPADQPIDTFIWDTRAGHCELYATAMALMVRSLGIPAQLVSGYRGGQWISGDSSYIVREDMAHVWVEVYFTGEGWNRFDPSPTQAEDESWTMDDLFGYIYRPLLKAKVLWYQNVIGFDTGWRLDRIGQLSFSFLKNPWGSRDAAAGPNTDGWLPTNPAFYMAILVTVVGIIMLRRSNSRRERVSRKGLGPDQLRAVRIFLTLRRRLRHTGIATENRTARELLESVEGTNQLDAEAIEQILEAYNTVRFGGRTMDRNVLARWLKLIRACTTPKNQTT